MGGLGAGLAVAGVVDDQHALVVGTGGRVDTQQVQPQLVDLLMIPAGLGEEPLQALPGRMLGTGDRLGAGQGGQGLVAIPGQQQALQVAAQAAALGQAREQRVEPLGVVLQGAGCGWAGKALGHRDHLSSDVAPQPQSYQPTQLNKLPLCGCGRSLAIPAYPRYELLVRSAACTGLRASETDPARTKGSETVLQQRKE